MSNDVFVDYYALLGVSVDASREEIERAFRRLAREYHPDFNPSPEAREKFHLLLKARETLIDPKRRRLYDREWKKLNPRRPVPEAKPAEARPASTEPLEEAPAPSAGGAPSRAGKDTLPLEKPSWNIEALYSRPGLALNGTPQILYTLTRIQPPLPRGHASIHHPLFICLMVDRSTSMQGRNLQLLRRVLGRFLAAVDPRDTLALIAFDDRPELLVPPRMGGAPAVLEALAHLKTRAATEYLPALRLAYEVLQSRPRNALPWLLFFTDGNTYDPDAVLAWLPTLSETQVVLDAFGLGTEWDDALLERMTAFTGGMMAYLRNEKEGVPLLVERMTRLKRAYVTQARARWRLNQGVRLRGLVRMAPAVTHYDAAAQEIVLGPLAPGEYWQLLWEWEIHDVPRTKDEEVYLGSITFYFRGSSGKEAHYQWDLYRPVLPYHLLRDHLPPKDVVKAVHRLTWSRRQAKARRAAHQGQVKDARRYLHALANHLAQAGEHEALQVVQRELDELRDVQRLSPKGEKELLHGTRRLLLPVLRRAEDV